jgi:hypothetical protein
VFWTSGFVHVDFYGSVNAVAGFNAIKHATAAQQMGEFFCGHRTTKKATLNFVAPLRAQIIKLRLGCHALGEGPEAKPMGHIDGALLDILNQSKH